MTDPQALAKRLTDAFDRCKLWPEQGWPEGMVNVSYMALLEIRNAVPQIVEALAAQSSWANEKAEMERQLAAEREWRSEFSHRVQPQLGMARLALSPDLTVPINPEKAKAHLDKICAIWDELDDARHASLPAKKEP